jgi:hypothetical protein
VVDEVVPCAEHASCVSPHQITEVAAGPRKSDGGDGMAKHPTEFPHVNPNLEWFLKIAEQNVTHKMIDDIGSQTAAICDHSISLVEGISNTFDCGFS